MSIELGLLQRPASARPSVAFEKTIVRIGALGSMCLLALTGLEYVGLVHTDISWFVVDQMVNGEARFNPNGDIHGDWGNQSFAVLAMPALLGYVGAIGISLARKLFTETAD